MRSLDFLNLPNPSSLNISQPHGPPRSVTRRAYFTLPHAKYTVITNTNRLMLLRKIMSSQNSIHKYEYIFLSVQAGGRTSFSNPLPALFFVIPFYLQYVLVHSANCVKTCIQWHVEECSVALLCN
jgi:hypothetical protein